MPRTATKKAKQESATTTVADLHALINKNWPGGMKYASDPEFVIERIPTGVLSIDLELNGGFARGRHTEIFGSYNVGKTYLCYRAIAQVQAAGGIAAFADVEGTFDPEFAASAGVDVDALLMIEHVQANEMVDKVETLLRSRAVDIISIDSIASLLPKSELEGRMDASTMGTAQAKLMSAALRRLTTANKRTAIVWINQTRESVNASMFAKRAITSGGKAMGFYAATRLELVRTETLKRNAKVIDIAKGDEKVAPVVYGHRVLVRVEKEKTGATHQGAETTFVYDYRLGAIDHIEDLLYLGRRYNLVRKNTSHWWLDGYEDEKQQGRARMKKFLRANPLYCEELEERIKMAYEESRDQELDDESGD